MGATFPNGIVNFVTHRDLLDDVEASDINKIQAEIVAIEEVLGSALTTVQQVEGQVNILTNEVDANTAEDAATLTKFQSLKDMVDYLWENQNVYAGEIDGDDDQDVPGGDLDGPPRHHHKTKKPSADKDPNSMWNGWGFTIKKSGFWNLSGWAQIAADEAAVNEAATYEASLLINGVKHGIHRHQPQKDKNTGKVHDVHLHPNINRFLTKGTHVALHVAHTSSSPKTVRKSKITAHRVRGHRK